MTGSQPNDKLHLVSREDGLRLTNYKAHGQDLFELCEVNANLDHPFNKWLVALGKCSTNLELILTESGKLRYNRIWLCKRRICPNCQMLTARKNVQLLLAKQEELRHKIQNPRYIFLTLTVPNCPLKELKTTVKAMSKAWNKMITALLQKNMAIGGFVRKLEVTRNSKTDEAHPHYHILLQVSPGYFGRNYITQEQWLKMWQRATGNDRITQVNIQAVKQGDTQALVELCKYEVKASELAQGELVKLEADSRDRLSDWLNEYMQQMKGIRSYSSGGTLKMKQLEEVSAVSEAGEDVDVAELKALWQSYYKHYKITKSVSLIERPEFGE